MWPMDPPGQPSPRRMFFAIDVVASPTDAFALISDISRHGRLSPQEFEADRLDGDPSSLARDIARQGAPS
jgi:hypothetical protein